jgi:hypothetical protein
VRCVVAEAEIALVSRDLGSPAKVLDAARATLERHGDRLNAAHARHLQVRRLLLIGRLDEAERALARLDPALFPPAWRAAYELVVAGIAMRRLRSKVARAALVRADHAAHEAGVPAQIAEVEGAFLVLNTPAARLTARGGELRAKRLVSGARSSRSRWRRRRNAGDRTSRGRWPEKSSFMGASDRRACRLPWPRS